MTVSDRAKVSSLEIALAFQCFRLRKDAGALDTERCPNLPHRRQHAVLADETLDLIERLALTRLKSVHFALDICFCSCTYYVPYATSATSFLLITR